MSLMVLKALYLCAFLLGVVWFELHLFFITMVKFCRKIGGKK